MGEVVEGITLRESEDDRGEAMSMRESTMSRGVTSLELEPEQSERGLRISIAKSELLRGGVPARGG